MRWEAKWVADEAGIITATSSKVYCYIVERWTRKTLIVNPFLLPILHVRQPIKMIVLKEPIRNNKGICILSKICQDKGIGWRCLRLIILFGIGMAIFTMLFEKKFIFFPSKYPDGRWDIPKSITQTGDLVPRVEDCWLETADNVRLHGWFATKGQYVNGTFTPVVSPSIILWCHGNAGNITDRFEKLLTMLNLPTDILLFDYRGYGRSEGTPSEEGLYLDAKAVWNYLLDKKEYRPETSHYIRQLAWRCARH